MADVTIVGGGPVGATLALGLADSGFRVEVLEARVGPEQPGDPRAIALSEGSRLILQRLGVWADVERHATAIRTIHISQKNRLGRSVLRAEDYDHAALGYVVGYAELAAAIDLALQSSGVEVLRGTRVTSVAPAAAHCTVRFEQDGQVSEKEIALAVVADGGRTLDVVPGLHRTVHEYGQSAVVARVAAVLPHEGVAYERFTPDGPIALLPWGESTYALVWTVHPSRAEELCHLDPAEFLAQCHAHFGDRAGKLISVSGRAAFPLKLARVRPVTAPHLAIIGNAAQTLHPVAGQGFNLGLRDAWELAGLVRSTSVQTLGSDDMLNQYRVARRMDTGGGMLFTDFLVRSFSNDLPGLGLLRGAGLMALELCAPARDFVVRKMSLGARG
jgi:2-octaprenyl-6-methoxyphenol hydroxylase